MQYVKNIQAGINRLRKDILFKECFHKDEFCDTKIIKAHSIQNNKILDKISENGKILSFVSSNNLGQSELEMKKTGKKKASIFTGFCQYHDNNIFQPIELFDYEKHNKEHEFLFAYRSLAWFHYVKKVEYLIYKKTFEIFCNKEENNIQKYFKLNPPYSVNFITEIKNNYSLRMQGSKDAVNELESIRTAMNINFNKKRYYKIETKIIEFNCETPIAVTSIINIENDLEGNLINDYCNKEKQLKPIFITIFPQKGKTYVLLSYLKNHKNSFDFIKEQITKQSIIYQKIIISNIIISYIENFFFSPVYWKSIDNSIKSKINIIFNNTIGQVNKPLIYDEELNIFL